MNETYVYSISFMSKSKDLDISKICPNELKSVDMKIGRISHPVPTLKNKNLKNKNIHPKDLREIKKSNEWKNSLKLIPIDIKHINSILNKLTDENYDKMLKETKTFNYSDPIIVSKLFNKVLGFSRIY